MGRPGVFVAALTLGMAAAASTAIAQVPLPTPAPQPKVGTAPSRPVPVQAAKPRALVAQAGPAHPAPGRSILKLDAAQGEGAGFSALQRARVDKVSAYLSSVQQLSGTFVQVGPDGRRLKGEFYIQKPGKVRFEYDPPSPVQIISNGQAVVVRDRKLATQDIYPLSQTPLRYLVADRIDLLRDTNVVSVHADDLFVTVVIEEKQIIVGTSRLMMMVSAKDYQLKQWTVTDPQGYDTTVAISNLDSKSRPDPGLFEIDFTRYQ
jgi:outer membrane lipoprotein-sorting protein